MSECNRRCGARGQRHLCHCVCMCLLQRGPTHSDPNMPKRFRSKRRNSVAAHKYRINKTKNYTYHNPEDVKAKIGDEDVTGQGNFYCESCCRHFASSSILEEHERSKDHKKEAKKRKWDDEMEKKEAALVADYKRKRTAASHSPPATEQHSHLTLPSLPA